MRSNKYLWAVWGVGVSTQKPEELFVLDIVPSFLRLVVAAAQ